MTATDRLMTAEGTRLGWLVDPRRREARIFRPDGSMTVTDADGALDGEGVLSGFSCPLAARPRRPDRVRAGGFQHGTSRWS